MGLINALFDNASEMDNQSVQQEISWMLTPNEAVQKSYVLIRDMFIFTNKRLVLIDKKGVSGKSNMITSIPYRNILSFAIETAGTFDMDSEVYISLVGGGTIMKQFKKNIDVNELYRVLSHHVV